MPGDRIDLSSEPPKSDTAGRAGSTNSSSKRSYIGIQFDCCGVYNRIYVNRDETAYVGNCPRCWKPVRIKVGPGGTDQRFFTAY